MATLDPYRGESETLCLSFDLGTTFSAVSIVHCIPGVVPKVRVVNRWPSSPNSSKIPTIILYDANGVAQAFGAEAKEEAILERAADEGWKEAKWFKLGLHAHTMQPPPYEELLAEGSQPRASNAAVPEPPLTFEVPPLPPKVTTEQCYKDFIAYLFKHARAWFIVNSPDGDSIWEKLAGTLTLVFAHPNSWDLHQQTVLKKAIASAGVMSIADTETRVMMVTESEASVHFGLTYATSQSEWLAPGSSFLVVDAGGSTVDICAYVVEERFPKLKLREAKTSDCTQSGSIFVTRAGEVVIKNRLGNSKFNTPEFIKAMVDVFDTKTKVVFSSTDDPYIIKFGYDRDMDKAAAISRGRLTLTGAEVQKAFDPCVDTIMRSIKSQMEGTNCSSILLVGGFGESPYLQKKIRQEFEGRGVRVVSADEPSRKAVSEGGALYFVKDNVVARATRFEYGVATMRPYSEFANEVGFRTIVVTPRGSKYIRGGWTSIVKQGQIIEADAVHRRSFCIDFKSTDLLTYSISLMTYTNAPGGPEGTQFAGGWSMNTSGIFFDNFVKCCTVTADLTPLAVTQPLLTNHATGEKYRDLDFELGLFFGLSSLKACLIWKENGVEKRGPASVIPSTFV